MSVCVCFGLCVIYSQPEKWIHLSTLIKTVILRLLVLQLCCYTKQHQLTALCVHCTVSIRAHWAPQECDLTGMETNWETVLVLLRDKGGVCLCVTMRHWVCCSAVFRNRIRSLTNVSQRCKQAACKDKLSPDLLSYPTQSQHSGLHKHTYSTHISTHKVTESSLPNVQIIKLTQSVIFDWA